jgi:acyl carrier protein
MDDYKKDIVSIASEILDGVPAAELENPDVELNSFPSYDSMSVVAFVTALEEKFDIAFDDDDLVEDNFRTMGDVMRVVRAKIGEMQ